MNPPPAGFVSTNLPKVPLRDRVAIFTSLGLLTLLCWIYLIDMAVEMNAPGADITCIMCVRTWTAREAGIMLMMWIIMMIGMMVPTALPMTLIYAAVAKKAAAQGSNIAPTLIFVLGYVVMWTLFSIAATAAQWGLDQFALLSPMMVTTSSLLGAAILISAGVYQLTPLKMSCLRHCRMPMFFISEHWRDGRWGAFRMGLIHGAFCLGCCWALMLLLFFGGVMSLFWIITITLFVLLEKIIPHGIGGAKLAGVLMILFGMGCFVVGYRA
jgi:predicted metal-binding membrane protein